MLKGERWKSTYFHLLYNTQYLFFDFLYSIVKQNNLKTILQAIVHITILLPWNKNLTVIPSEIIKMIMIVINNNNNNNSNTATYQALCLAYYISFTLLNWLSKINTIVIPFSQLRKLRHRKVSNLLKVTQPLSKKTK